MNEVITQAATAVAEANAAAVTANTALAAAEKQAAEIRSRVAALNAKRQSIAAERAGGRQDLEHAGKLALIEMDVATLAPVLAAADADVGTAKSKVGDAAAAVDLAQQNLIRVQDGEALQRLVAHIDKVAGILWNTLGEIDAACKALGVNRAPWFPSADLVTALRRLDLNRPARV